jgi:hypothetical protein
MYILPSTFSSITFEKELPTCDVTNPVSIPSFYCIYDIHLLILDYGRASESKSMRKDIPGTRHPLLFQINLFILSVQLLYKVKNTCKYTNI